ncbi:MAG: hypothetical protein MJ240_07715 [Kiritimatiellae bacterium]|nr:hypothetical protein [Kiritimatiellia bacterium]
MKYGLDKLLLGWLTVQVLAAGAVELPYVSAQTGFAEFAGAQRCRVIRHADRLELTDIKRDCSIVFDVPAFFGRQADSISVTYQAEGTGGGGGEVFYADAARAFSQDQMFRQPPIVADGKWHTLTLNLTNELRKGAWEQYGLISRLRWDPVNTAGGKVTFRELKVWNSRAVANAESAVDQAFEKKWEQGRWPDVVSEIPKTNAAEWVARVAPKAEKVHEVTCFGGSVQPMRVKAGEKAMFRYDFSGLKPTEAFDATVDFYADKVLLWREQVRVDGLKAQAFSEKRWRLQFACTMPKYYDTRRITAVLSSPALAVVDGTMPAAPFTLVRNDAALPCAGRSMTSAVKMLAGVPQFYRNGQPFYALWAVGRGNGGLAAGNPFDVPHHSNAPFDLNTLWPAPRMIWPKMGEFQSVIYDKFAVELTRQFGEDCLFMVEIPLTPPPDWREANPDDMCQQEDGTINTDCGDNFINYSFASKKARAAMLETLEKAIAYLERAPYANRIYGYRIASGHTYEWLGWDATPRSALLDFSPVAKKGFAAYLAKHHPEIQDRSVPGKAERFARGDGDLFADLGRNPRCKAYYDFYCEELAETMKTICGRAKELLGGRKVVGTYYGYTMTLFDGGNQMRAHYALDKVLASGKVDFLMSPQPYRVRQLGGTCGDMKPFSSMQNHGILPVLEDDTRSHLHIKQGYSQAVTEEQMIGLMRRNMGVALCRWQPFYALAMNFGLNFDYPLFGYDVAALKAAGDFAIGGKAPRRAEIAVVVSEEAIKALPRYRDTWDTYAEMYQEYKEDDEGKVTRSEKTHGIPVLTENYNRIYNRICRLGAPVDYLLAEDLENARDYRLYVFLNCSYASEKLVRAVAKLRTRDCTLLWSHAPGYMGDTGSGVEWMKKLTGVDFKRLEGAFDPIIECRDGRKMGGTGNVHEGPFFSMISPDETLGRYAANGEPAWAFKKTGLATTVHCGSYRMEMPFLREVAKRAGVWSFTANDDPVEANGAFLLLHARYAGKKHIRLPKKCDVVDVFNRKLVARNVDAFSFDSPLHASWLFYYGDEADELLEKLNY